MLPKGEHTRSYDGHGENNRIIMQEADEQGALLP